MNTTAKKEALKKALNQPRKREAWLNHFYSVDLAGQFKIILRQKNRLDAYRLFNLLPHEEKLLFFWTHFKGVKVKWCIRARAGGEGITFGYALDIFPKVGKFVYSFTLAQFVNRPPEDVIFKKIKTNLPTVVIL